MSVGKDDVFMIDTTYAVPADKLLAAMVTITTKPVKTLVITHFSSLPSLTGFSPLTRNRWICRPGSRTAA